MWVFSRQGFYSVVRYDRRRDVAPLSRRKSRGAVLVRSQWKEDLEALVEIGTAVGIRPLRDVQHTPAADYPYRVVLRRKDWKQLAATLADDVDYVNFKDTIADNERHNTYMDVWCALRPKWRNTEWNPALGENPDSMVHEAARKDWVPVTEWDRGNVFDTGCGLQSKADIAAELAHAEYVAELERELERGV